MPLPLLAEPEVRGTAPWHRPMRVLGRPPPWHDPSVEGGRASSRFVNGRARNPSTSSSIPDISKKLVHRHRFAEATAALAAHREAEAGRETTRRFVLPFLDVRGHALDTGTTPEVTDGHAHRLRRDSFVAPVLPHPPPCFDFVGCDSLDAIARETQLSGAGVTQCIVRVPRRSCVLGFVERGKRRQDQPRRSESDRLRRRVSYGVSFDGSGSLALLAFVLDVRGVDY